MDFSIPQKEAIDIRNTNVVVSASAGSGKTAILVERLCQLVLKDHISIAFEIKGTTKNGLYSATNRTP